jgi:hypothetical protein
MDAQYELDLLAYCEAPPVETREQARKASLEAYRLYKLSDRTDEDLREDAIYFARVARRAMRAPRVYTVLHGRVHKEIGVYRAANVFRADKIGTAK